VGDARSVLQNREDAEWEETPEISGVIRTAESDFFGDESSQHFGGDSSARPVITLP
jgi:DNA recombination-dependent growth factor C